MASIRQRGNSYQVTISNGYRVDGTKITVTDTFTPEPNLTKKKQETALAEFVADFERTVKSGKNICAGRLTLKALSDMYLKDMVPPTLARSTYKDYSDRISNRIIPAMGHLKIGAIRQKDVNDYRKMLLESYKIVRNGKGLSEATIRKDCAIISALLSYAVSEGYLDMNMLIYSGRAQKRHYSDVKSKKPEYFEPEQLIRFIDALEHPIEVTHNAHPRKIKGENYTVKAYTQTFIVENNWKLYFYIALFAGDRRGENISFRWNDLNMETGSLIIDTSTDYVYGTMQEKSTKGRNARNNTLPQYVLDIAKTWKKEQMQRCLRLGDRWKGYHGKDYDKNFIFTQANGKQMHICSPYTKFKRIIRLYNEFVAENEADKIPDDVPPHGLRHSAAAILIANNMDARTVAEILGHENPSTTLNIYSYFFKNKGKEATAIMEQVLLRDRMELTELNKIVVK